VYKKPKTSIEKCSQTHGKLKFVVLVIKFGHVVALEKLEEYAQCVRIEKIPSKKEIWGCVWVLRNKRF
jgi:hypothetical protein